MQVPTVKIKAKNKEGFIVINESDFDEKKDRLYQEPIPKPEKEGKTSKARVSSTPATRNKEDNPFE